MKSKKLKLFLGSLFTLMLLFNVFVGVQQNDYGKFSGITLKYIGQMAFAQGEGGGENGLDCKWVNGEWECDVSIDPSGCNDGPYYRCHTSTRGCFVGNCISFRPKCDNPGGSCE